MKKSDFKSGMVAEFKNGLLGLFVLDTFITYNDGGISLNMIRDDFTVDTIEDYDIKKIIQPLNNNGFNAGMEFWLEDKQFIKYEHDVLWERDTKEEMTIAEIEKALGKCIKIVK